MKHHRHHQQRTLGGTLDLHALGVLAAGAADYHRRAQLHRPRSAAQMHGEVIRLYRTGLSASDVASALRLPLDQVVNAVAASMPAPANITRPTP